MRCALLSWTCTDRADRVLDEETYTQANCLPISLAFNRAKSSSPVFTSREKLLAYCRKKGIVIAEDEDVREPVVRVVRQMLV